MIGWLWWACWLDLWAEILQPAPREACPVVNLADWRRDHPCRQLGLSRSLMAVSYAAIAAHRPANIDPIDRLLDNNTGFVDGQP